jgi:hypothetical protein
MKDKMNKPADEMSEALMRRRHTFASKSPMHASAGGEEMPEQAEAQNRGAGGAAPAGATPEGQPLMPMDGDAMAITPEMFIEMMGSRNAGGLRGRAMAHAEDMKKKC